MEIIEAIDPGLGRLTPIEFEAIMTTRQARQAA
jgi:hypothetical protein